MKNLLRAFSLAEVLITLGIIGVVAAITLPALVQKYKIKQFKTGFLRTSSLIQNTLNQSANEFGYDNYRDLFYICGNVSKGDAASKCSEENAELFKQINDDFFSRLKVVDTKSGWAFFRKEWFTDYSGKYKADYGSLYGIGIGDNYERAHILVDGTMISNIIFFKHEPSDGLTITFDTNGPYKGPNQYGRDIFMFNTGSWYKLCSVKAGGSLYNGRGCYEYAEKDINPDDKSKGYWDSLKF